MNHDQIESAIERAIDALALAKLALSKSVLPVFNDSDVLRKGLAEPSAIAGYDPSRALATLADAERRLDALEARRDQEAQQEREEMARRLGKREVER